MLVVSVSSLMVHPSFGISLQAFIILACAWFVASMAFDFRV